MSAAINDENRIVEVAEDEKVSIEAGEQIESEKLVEITNESNAEQVNDDDEAEAEADRAEAENADPEGAESEAESEIELDLSTEGAKMIRATRVETDDEWEDDLSIHGPYDDDDAHSTGSDLDETLAERLAALVDIVHPRYRHYAATVSTATSSVFSSAVTLSTRSFWVLSTSMLLLGVPWALAYSEDQQLMEMEREERMRMMGNEVLTQGAAGPSLDGLGGGQEIKGTA